MKKIFMILVVMLLFCGIFVLADLEDITVIQVSLVNQDPDPVIAGDIVELRLGVENLGGEPAYNTTLVFEPQYPFELVSSSTEMIGTVKGFQQDENMRIVKYKVRVNSATAAGTYSLDIYNYHEKNQERQKDTVSIDVKSTDNAEVIYIDKTNLLPGKESSLKFTINNVGNAPLRDLIFKWNNEDKVILPIGSDNRKYIREIGIDNSVVVEYQVIADSNADPGLYELDLSLTYTDPITGSSTVTDTIAGVYVGGDTDFDVAFSEASSGEMSFSVANIGSTPAYSVSVKVPKQDNWRVSGSNSVIIGNLNQGDYTVASFSLQSAMQRSAKQTSTTDNSVRGQHFQRNQKAFQGQSGPLLIEVAYTNTMGERKTIEKEVELNPMAMAVTSTGTDSIGINRMRTQQQESFISKYKWYIIAIAIVIGFFWVRGKYKKKKLADPNFKLFGKKKK